MENFESVNLQSKSHQNRELVRLSSVHQLDSAGLYFEDRYADPFQVVPTNFMNLIQSNVSFFCSWRALQSGFLSQPKRRDHFSNVRQSEVWELN